MLNLKGIRNLGSRSAHKVPVTLFSICDSLKWDSPECMLMIGKGAENRDLDEG